MTTEQAHQLIDLLEQAQRRPGLFFPLDRSGFLGFLDGIHATCLAFFGPPPPATITDTILRERGWDAPNAIAPWAEMEARQYDLSAMIHEVLTIEIETLRRQYGVAGGQQRDVAGVE